MNKRFLLYILFLLVCNSAFSQFDTTWVKKNISACADSLTSAFKARDWAKYTRYTNPALIGTMRGVENFKSMVSSGFAVIPDNAWEKYEQGKILQVVKAATDMQATIELKSVLLMGQTRICTTTCLVGQSWDGGQFWTFFSSDGSKETAKHIKPDLSDLLLIPKTVETKEPFTQTKN